MTTIQAAVCTGFGADYRLETLHLRPPGHAELEVTLGAVAICHSDISYGDGDWGGDLPMVLGHEASGTVSAIGAGVSGFAVGDRVVVTLIRACGHCVDCGSGRPTLCHMPAEAAPKLTRADGTPVTAAMNCGAFAERVLVDQSQIVKLSTDIGFDAAALLACGVITGVGAAVHAGRLRAGEDVVVIGAGGVGLNAIQGARLAGARRIVAVDMTPEKLADAKAFGATDGVLASQHAPWKAAYQAMGKGADLVLVTVGALPAYDSAPKYLGWGGRMVMVGMPPSGAMAKYEPVMQAFTGQSLIGSKMGDVVIARDIPWMEDLHAQGRLQLETLVSGRWRLDQINEAIANTRAGRARRNVIVF